MATVEKDKEEGAGGDENEEDRREPKTERAAELLSGLSDQLMDEKLKDSLELVDITFTCRSCGIKAKSLQELMGHMKDGQCTTKKRPRGRPRKTDQANQDKKPPKPKEPVSTQPTERVTRVKSGAIKRKSVADLFIKQEITSSDDEDYMGGVVKRRKRTKHDPTFIDLDLDEQTMEKDVDGMARSISGTEALAANKEAKLSGKEVRIPIGKLRHGESKIIKLKTATGDNLEELQGSILQIREIDNKPVVEVLSEEQDTEKANATIYLRTGARKNEEEVMALAEAGENIQFVEMNPQEIMEEMHEEQNDSQEEEEMGREENLTDLAELQNVQLSDMSESENQILKITPEIKRRRYTRLPAALEYTTDSTPTVGKDATYSTKCKKCVQRWFQTKEELDVHYRLHIQGKEIGYQCDQCDYKNTNWGRMMYHIIKHPEYCEQLKGTNMMKNIYGSFECPECKKIFDLKSNLSTHYNKMHNGESKWCLNCNKLFDNMDEKKFERHVDKCKSEELKCQFCPYTTTVRSNMRIHLRVHSGEGFSCHVCGKTFPTKQRQEVHVQKHLEDRQRFPCEFCGADFCSKDAVKKHVQRIHAEKEVLYQCSVCAYQTKHQPDLKKHMKAVHFKKYHCAVENCEYSTNREDQLTMHSEYHNPERVFRCDYPNCYTAFSTHRNLVNHMQGLHKVGCKHQCPICLKFFKKKTVLLRHLVSHTTERPYSCQECGETFTCHSTYYRHRNRTGHDSRREGVASVPQNISIKYVEASGLTTDFQTAGNVTAAAAAVGGGDVATVVESTMDFGGVAVVTQKTLDTSHSLTLTNDPATSFVSIDNSTDGSQHQQHIITLDPSQFAQLEQQQQQQQDGELNDSNVTYYITYEGEGGNNEVMVMENTNENETLEAIPLDENTAIGADIEAYNREFINLDLPKGPAFVKVDENGSLMVVNSLGQSLETEEVVAGSTENSQEEELQHSDLLDLNETVTETTTETPANETGISEEIVYQEMRYIEEPAKEQYVIYQDNVGDGVTVVEGESAAAYSMLELQGGQGDGEVAQ